MNKWSPQKLRIADMAYVGNGVLLYTCNAENSNLPMGSVWVNPTSDSYKRVICEILDIYVPENYRRNGIGTYMMKWLLDGYGILRTGTGTKLGLPLMKSLGWKKNKQTGDWYLFGKVKKV